MSKPLLGNSTDGEAVHKVDLGHRVAAVGDDGGEWDWWLVVMFLLGVVLGAWFLVYIFGEDSGVGLW